MEFLTAQDLAPYAEIDPVKAEAMIADATALAVLAAPCLDDDPTTLTDAQQQAVKAILRGAIIRWNESGSGALQSESVLSYSYTQDTRQARRSLFWPSEITQLQGICNAGGSDDGGAFGIDTRTAGFGVHHADICALNFGATYCSCGAVLTGAGPLWEST